MSRAVKMFKTLGLEPPRVPDPPEPIRQENKGVSDDLLWDGASISSFNTVELQALNPDFVETLSPHLKCRAWLERQGGGRPKEAEKKAEATAKPQEGRSGPLVGYSSSPSSSCMKPGKQVNVSTRTDKVCDKTTCDEEKENHGVIKKLHFHDLDEQNVQKRKTLGIPLKRPQLRDTASDSKRSVRVLREKSSSQAHNTSSHVSEAPLSDGDEAENSVSKCERADGNILSPYELFRRRLQQNQVKSNEKNCENSRSQTCSITQGNKLSKSTLDKKKNQAGLSDSKIQRKSRNVIKKSRRELFPDPSPDRSSSDLFPLSDLESNDGENATSDLSWDRNLTDDSDASDDSGASDVTRASTEKQSGVSFQKSSHAEREASDPSTPVNPARNYVDEDLGSNDEDPNPTTAEKPPNKQEQKQLNKRKRNLGLEYTTSSKKTRGARVWKPIHTCKKNQCQDIITAEVAGTILKEYWGQGELSLRRLYVASRMEVQAKQRTRKRKDNSGKNRTCTINYFLFVDDVKHRVCRETFLNVLGETDAFVRRIAEKKSKSGTTSPDKRGRRKPKHKTSDFKRNAILNHIASFPRYVSHYSRKESAQKYLPSTLNKSIMYQEYCSILENPKVSYSTYRRVFKMQGLKFKPPHNDTCAKCDKLVMLLQCAQDEEEKKRIQTLKELHNRKADQAYNLKKKSKVEWAMESDGRRVLVFDLEQCLPTPHLKCSKVYYSRQLYVYNLTIYDTKTKITYCYMWHEGEGCRGANEIASCVFVHFMTHIPDYVTDVRLFSDSCGGQNKNSIVAAMFWVLLQTHPSVKVIEHIFLVPGHTRNECDTKHSIIEREKAKVDKIEVPEEWFKLVEKAGSHDPEEFPEGKFKVKHMKNEFRNFAALLASKTGSLIKRDVDENGDRFYWNESAWFRYHASSKCKLQVKSAFNEDAPFRVVHFSRNKKMPPNNLLQELHNLPNWRAIAEAKKKDVLDLLQFVSQEHHEFYHNLRTTNDAPQDVDPDLPSEEEEEEL